MALAMQQSLCSSRRVASTRSEAASCHLSSSSGVSFCMSRRIQVTTAAAEAGHRNTTKHARKSLVKPVHPVVSSGTTTKFNKAPVNGLKQSQLGVCIGAAAAVQAYLQLLTVGPEGLTVAIGIAAVAASVAFPVAAANFLGALQSLVLTVLTTIKPNGTPRARQATASTKKSLSPSTAVPATESLVSKLTPAWGPRDLTTLAYGPLPAPNSTVNSTLNSTVKLPQGWGPRDLTTLAFEGCTPVPVYPTLSTAPQDTPAAAAAAADVEVSGTTAVQYDDVSAPLPPSPILAQYAPSTTPLMLTKPLPLDSLASEISKDIPTESLSNSEIFKMAPTAEGLAHAAAQLAKVIPSDPRTGLAAICVSNSGPGYFNPSNGKFCGGRIANVGAVRRAQGSVARFLAGTDGRTVDGVELPRVEIEAGASFGDVLAREWDSLKVYVVTPADYHLQGGKKLTYGDLFVHAAYGIPMASSSDSSNGSSGSEDSGVVSSGVSVPAAVSAVSVMQSPVGAAAVAAGASSAAAEGAVTGVSGVSAAAVAAAKCANSNGFTCTLLRVAKALPAIVTAAASSIASLVSSTAGFSHTGLGVSTYGPEQLGH